MKKIFILALTLIIAIQTKAQVLAWNLFDKLGNETTVNSTTNHPNIAVATLKRGAGITAATAGQSFAGTFPINADKDAVIAAASYYEFTLTPKASTTLSLTTLDVVLRIQTNAPPTYIWRYSKDGGNTFNDIGSARTWTTNFSQNNGIQEPTLDLSGVADLQNFSTPIIFRLYAWGGTSTTSNNGFRIGKSLTNTSNALAIGGVVKPILSWNLFGAVGDEVKATSTTNHASIDVSELTRGTGIAGGIAGGSYASTFPINIDKDAAIAAASYYEFTLKPKGNAVVSLTTLNVILRIQTSAPPTYIWRYSKDGGATFNDVGTAVTWITNFNQNNGIQEPTLDLSGITDLQQLTVPVIFRLYAWGGTSATSNNGFRIGKSLSVTQDALAISGIVEQENTLPITLLNFVGKLAGDRINLNWATSSEQNNAYFELIRSEDGKNPKLIGKVQGKGNSAVKQNYSFTDLRPLVGDNYYQLKQVDIDGKNTLSEIIHVNASLDKSSMKIFSSTGNNQTNFTVFVLKEGVGNLKIVDITGKKIYEATQKLGKGDNQFQINVKGSGIFVASLTIDKQVINTKFFKN
ncbi:T9SS type A sorting domain-containing protein [Pedobacter sp. ASV28]|uniref:T9SS type A sorting domain-containing protein n=1 Tax=Pedobacter sp. ASV28 TaxID=2795123 RepID=UPI0018EB145C|nr:T9SS type A sorting domain-containing protein [Pedobacter sp. ASV28]